ncbi:hypothetical protein [Actinocorallia sp. A-T 12471]|uniref:hypothetical protein n=1 Tax=Actinocorallia sp. A-T 12471 TaxID=3089813 RepID=UPI0029CC1136|nr:hypothetical protein [Actinocorallia sp. A-T 12471]MDX6743573.1 hypothetical protein [Actinocorallia sp. A-T 12471]
MGAARIGIARLPDTRYHDVTHAITGAIAAVAGCLAAFSLLYWAAAGIARAFSGRGRAAAGPDMPPQSAA